MRVQKHANVRLPAGRAATKQRQSLQTALNELEKPCQGPSEYACVKPSIGGFAAQRKNDKDEAQAWPGNVGRYEPDHWPEHSHGNPQGKSRAEEEQIEQQLPNRGFLRINVYLARAMRCSMTVCGQGNLNKGCVMIGPGKTNIKWDCPGGIHKLSPVARQTNIVQSTPPSIWADPSEGGPNLE